MQSAKLPASVLLHPLVVHTPSHHSHLSPQFLGGVVAVRQDLTKFHY